MSDKDYKQVLLQIDELNDMAGDGYFPDGKKDWKTVWNKIREIGAAFKGSKFPSQQEHQAAWERFQTLIDTIKEQQEAENKLWQQKKQQSGEVRKEIIALARQAKPADPPVNLEEVIEQLTPDAVLSEIFLPFDERRDYLKDCRERLKNAFDRLSGNKDEMLGRDKNEAYSVLNKIKEELDTAWETYSKIRQTTYDKYREVRRQKHEDWVERIETNIKKLEERHTRLADITTHKEEHLIELQSKQAEAWSEEFRIKVTGWIGEEESVLQDLKEQLEQVDGWLQESRKRLK